MSDHGLNAAVFQSVTVKPSDGFDLHPFIKEHPEAVFINLTSVKEKTDRTAIYDAAYKLAGEMFVKTPEVKDIPNSTKITCKPNWTCSTGSKKDPYANLGITTDLNFIEGYLECCKKCRTTGFLLRECACAFLWKTNGYQEMADRNNFNLKDLSSKNYWDLGDEIIFKKVDGVVFQGGRIHGSNDSSLIHSLLILPSSRHTRWELPGR